MESLKKMDEFLEKAMDIVTVSLLLMLLVLLLANIFLRMVPICSLRWYNEIVELIFAWFIFIGVAAVWRKKEHSYVEYLPNKIVDTKWELLFKTIIELLSLGFVASFLYYSSLLTIRVTAVSPVLQLSRKLFYIPMVLS